MLKMASPVLKNLAEDRLHETFPFDFHPDRRPYALLEAFGRLMLGMAPWLELDGLEGEEAQCQKTWRETAQAALGRAVDPEAADAMNFDKGYGQALVDAAFLAHALVRAPRVLAAQPGAKTKDDLIRALLKTRSFTPFVSNWILFSGMVEAGLHVLGVKADMTRVDYAVQMMRRWYVGDGTYSDGDMFHWDYYNSFVIQPMLVDILTVFEKEGRDYPLYLQEARAHASRYARVLESMISPDGSWAVFGRSSVYRTGCFQLLAQAALNHFLPESLKPAQVRGALDAAIDRTLGCRDSWDQAGFLTPGIVGYQPGLAEEYISVGSLYLASTVFLPLGLPASDPFWSDPDAPWTAKLIWGGTDVMRDHAED